MKQNTEPVESQSPEQTGHTKGPWEIHKWSRSNEKGGKQHDIWNFSGENCDNKITVTASTKHLPTSRTFGDFTGCIIAEMDIAYEGESEALANARLIAAAPDLLEACKRLIEDSRFMRDEYSDMNIAVHEAEEVIRKAEGKP